MQPYLSLKNINKNFNGIYALSDISLTINTGEVHCIVGQNGCGKSTLIKIISGVYTPDSGGVIEINQKQYSALTPARSVHAGIQVIYQDLSLFPNLTVAENIMINCYHNHWLRPARMMVRRSQEILNSIGSNLQPNELVKNLTVSKCQIVAIARALAEQAKLIIMDEPTASLTHNEVQHLLSYIKLLKEQGIAIIFVSHKLDEVMAVSSRITVLKDGKLVTTSDAANMDSQKLGQLMTGQNITFRPVTSTYPDEVVLACQHLTKTPDYHDVNLSVHRGEILAITGLLGSGRTELCLSLFGLNKPDSGKILLEGRPIHFKSNRDAMSSGIAYVSEDRMDTGLVVDQSIANNITSTRFRQLQPKFGLFNTNKATALVDDLVNQLKIKVSDMNDAVTTLSGGNAQRVSIAKWLAIEPKVLILDSPTVGVDIANKSGIYDIIKALAKTGVAIIIVTDEIEEALYNSHTITVLANGHIKQTMVTQETSEAELAEVING